MPDIPIIPGVSVATKGILNQPLKNIICAILFGGINNMLKGPLLCVKADLDKLIQDNFPGVPSLNDLRGELMNLRHDFAAFEDHIGIKETLGRINGAVAEVQNLLALDGLCAIPLKAPPIPDVLAQIADAEYGQAMAILNDIGMLSKPQLCLNGPGGGFGGDGGLLSTGTYNPSSILGNIQQHIKQMQDIPSQKINQLKFQINNVSNALHRSMDRELFPDFRHKHDLTTGQPYNGSAGAITLAPPPPISHQWNPPYPPSTVPNLKDATNTAQTLVSGVSKTGSYPATVNGIKYANMWPGLLGPDVYNLAVQALKPQDPYFGQEQAIYDYCGKLVGYTANTVSGDPAFDGKSATEDAELNPPVTSWQFIWIAERNCWAVDGVMSEQIVNGRKDMYLTPNPIVELHRGYNHVLGIPSLNVLGDGLAEEFFIYKVKADLTPDTTQKFNLGLSRLETYELLEDANGLDEPGATERKQSFPTGTSLYFAAEAKIYSGNTPPDYPTELVWWYNLTTCNTQKWVPSVDENGLPGGAWVEVGDQERLDHWVGSSNIHGAPNANYLCYSNKDGSVFGLFKLI
ncbi:hypothetical protein UFOVP71_93 [uncultured Caudovirales phage]|uniref:Uncharacterized protein n=1 Tax=uncultured Caudovirales phage TaxID=2100421 RepID=A0A6J5T9F9_9CAUD|nr:hypothetical protein UFOVP71_93 [uncultured Caudovirales phage]